MTWIYPSQYSLSMHNLESEWSKIRQVIKGFLANWQILYDKPWQQNILPAIWQLHFEIED